MTIADTDIRSLKSLHTLFVKYLDHMLVKFGGKMYGLNFTKFWAFWQKMVNHIWQSIDVILEDVSVTEAINLKTAIFCIPKIPEVLHM